MGRERIMNLRKALVVAVCLLGGAGCRSTTVRGPGDQSLTATAPRSMTIKRGGSAPLTVAIDQENFRGPVTVSISRLSTGVEADEASQTVETTSATFILRASLTADLVTDQAVLLTVEGLNGRKASQVIDVSVRD